MARKILQKSCIMFLMVCLLAAIPQQIYAEEKTFDFNNVKEVTLLDQESYGTTEGYTWIQYKPAADGYLTIKVSALTGATDSATGYLTLYDSTKKRVLSSKSIFYNTKNSENAYWYQIIFGLQKDQIYYIRVKALNGVKITRSFKKVNDKSGQSQVSAIELKKKKVKTGLITADSSTADWYKIKIDKSQKIHLYYNAKTSGSFRVSVYSGKKRLGSRNIYYTKGYKKITIYQYQSSTGKNVGMNPGEYYFKIEKADSLSSGYYKIKWK